MIVLAGACLLDGLCVNVPVAKVERGAVYPCVAIAREGGSPLRAAADLGGDTREASVPPPSFRSSPPCGGTRLRALEVERPRRDSKEPDQSGSEADHCKEVRCELLVAGGGVDLVRGKRSFLG